MRKYSLIFITRNSEDLERLVYDIETLESTEHLASVVIVDNGSDDEHIDQLLDIKDQFLEIGIPIELIFNDQNLLYTRAVNQALEYLSEEDSRAVGDFWIVVNPDIRIHYSYWGTELDPFADVIEDMCRVGADIAGAKLLFPGDPEVIEHAGGTGNSHRGYRASGKEFAEADTVEWVTGALFVISRKAFQTLGYLDAETFPHWVSDQEYCRRGALCGLQTAYSPTPFVHNQGHSTQRDSHVECWMDLPEHIEPNTAPVGLPFIVNKAAENAKLVPFPPLA